MSSIRGVNVGGNLFDVTDTSNVAPIETTNFASRDYAKDRCFIMADGLLYRATVSIASGDPIVINGNCKRTTLDEIISVIGNDLIAPTEDGATSSDDYAVDDEIVRSGILYKVISAIAEGDAFVIGNNIDIAGSLTSQIQTLMNQVSTLNTKATNKVLYLTGIACSATTGNFVSYSNSAITADHVVAECVFANPSAVTVDTWTTANGSLTLNGTCSTATTVNVVLIKKDN